MEPITMAALAAFLAPYFQKAGEKLAEKTVEIALEHRQDIKDKFVSLFKPDEIISLGLDKPQTPEEAKALQEANPETAAAVRQRIETNRDLLDELAKIISKQEGRVIHAHNYIEHIDTATFN